MQVSASVDIRGAMNALKIAQASPAKRERALEKAAVKHVSEIEERTKKGIGTKGRFKSYSKAYFAHLVERGKGNPTIPNLLYSGNMLNNLGVTKATPKYALISFSSALELKKAEKNQKTRPFMGITASEQKEIMKVFKRELFK